MKKTVAHPEVIASQSRTRIEKLLRACKKLKTAYQKLDGLFDCPLCTVVGFGAGDGCGDCPWYSIKGFGDEYKVCCSERRGVDISWVRITPQRHKGAAAYRVRELTWWIEVYESELERRGPKPATCVRR
jgi:hypothetical protein